MPVGPQARTALTAIRWDLLRHPWGPATDVPGLLERLLDAEESAGVDVALWQRGYHDGAANGATAAISTVLLAMLDDGVDPSATAALLHFLRISVEADRSPTFALIGRGTPDPALDPRAPIHAHLDVVRKYAGREADADWLIAWAADPRHAPRPVRWTDLADSLVWVKKMAVYALILVIGGLLAGFLNPF